MIKMYSPLSPQQRRALELLTSGWTTVGEALLQAGIYAFSQRCGELERAGYPIEKGWFDTSGGARIRKYRIAQ